jgi:hypothetical protein
MSRRSRRGRASNAQRGASAWRRARSLCSGAVPEKHDLDLLARLTVLEHVQEVILALHGFACEPDDHIAQQRPSAARFLAQGPEARAHRRRPADQRGDASKCRIGPCPPGIGSLGRRRREATATTRGLSLEERMAQRRRASGEPHVPRQDP